MSINDANKTYSDDQSATADILNLGDGTQAALTVGTSSVEVKAGPTRMEGRKSISVFNNSNNTVFWGYNSSVTSSTGTPIFPRQFWEWCVGEDQPVFLVAAQNGNDIRITECA